MAKRWHSEVSNTALDCQSLGSSLKRVRISASPGELRLERDLKHLADDSDWTKVSESQWLYGGNARLERHGSNPLRLLMTVGQIHVTIQFPRMYPHRPPVVSRVTYPPCSERATLHPTLSPTTSRNSSHQQLRLEQVIVTVAPPVSTTDEREEIPASMKSTYGTVVYDRWSPVQCLEDLLRFVVGVLEQQPHGKDATTHGHGIMETDNEDGKTHFQHINDGAPQDSAWMEETAVDDRTTDDSARKLEEVFPPNRFDLGYEKPAKEILASMSKDYIWVPDCMET